MKNSILKAVFMALVIMIGLLIADLVLGDGIQPVRLIVAGVVIGIVDFLFSFVSEKRKENI